MQDPETDTAREWEDALAAALRDEAPGPEVRGAPLARILETATTHGVAPLLHFHLSRSGRWAEWPTGLGPALEQQAILAALVLERRRIEVGGILEALRASGVDVLLMKGVPLSYTHYPRPGLRPALDTDLLIPEVQKAATFVALQELGYELIVQGTGQVSFRKPDTSGSWHHLDCHWCISGNTVRARDFPFGELAARSVPVPALGPAARALCAVDALLVCGIHFAHHCGRERLVWLYDVRLLAGSLDERELSEFEGRARERRVRAVCAAILERTRSRLGPVLLAGSLARYRSGPRWLAAIREPSAGFLPGRSPLLFESLATLRNLESREARFRFLRGLLVGPLGSPGATDAPTVSFVARRLAKGVVRYVIQGRPVQRGVRPSVRR